MNANLCRIMRIQFLIIHNNLKTINTLILMIHIYNSNNNYNKSNNNNLHSSKGLNKE